MYAWLFVGPLLLGVLAVVRIWTIVLDMRTTATAQVKEINEKPVPVEANAQQQIVALTERVNEMNANMIAMHKMLAVLVPQQAPVGVGHGATAAEHPAKDGSVSHGFDETVDEQKAQENGKGADASESHAQHGDGGTARKPSEGTLKANLHSIATLIMVII
jgi:hypothetical protein